MSPTAKLFDLTFDLDDICREDGDLDLNCSGFQSGRGDREEITLFMGVGVRGEVDHHGSSDSVDPKNYPDGRYIRLKMSSVVTPAHPLLKRLYRGENRLGVVFQGDGPEDEDGLYAYYQKCQDEPPGASPYRELSGEGESQKVGHSSGAGARTFVKNLKNRQCYSVQLYYRDKYGFASGVSGGLDATPESLEKLLEENSCFLLTAGFGGDAPLIDDFRHFRDRTLSASPGGRFLIRFYYRHAPALAPLVAASPLLSAWIRASAHAFRRIFLEP